MSFRFKHIGFRIVCNESWPGLETAERRAGSLVSLSRFRYNGRLSCLTGA